jgi:hypothetical protein
MEPQSSLGDRAVVIAGVLAILLVELFGAAPDQPPAAAARAVQSAQR